MGESPNSDDCAVCLQPRIYPAQLPCGHIFCFLCLKGVAHRSKRCAICRQDIPSDYMSHPVLLEESTISTVETTVDGGTNSLQWFYEGRNGWWKYDERSNAELEEKWLSGADECQLQVAGILYKIDFPSMLQTRLHDPSKRRKIKRDASTVPAKGIAGIKIETAAPVAQQSNVENQQDKSDNDEDLEDQERERSADELEDLGITATLQSLQLEIPPDSLNQEQSDRENVGEENNNTEALV